MNHSEADAVLRAVFAPWPHVALTDDLRSAWWEIALHDSEYAPSLKIARALAAACEYAPVPKQFLEMRRAVGGTERKRELPQALPPLAPKPLANAWTKRFRSGMDRIGRGGSNSGKHEAADWERCESCKATYRQVMQEVGQHV